VTAFLSTLSPGVARGVLTSSGRWSVETLLPSVDVRSLAVDPTSQSHVWAGTQGAGVLRSDDAGVTWTSAGLDGRIVKSLTAGRDGRVYAGTKPALMFVTENDGRTWQELAAFRKVRRFFWFSPAETPFTAYVQSIAVEGEGIVVGVEAGAVVRSTDRGRTWQGHRPGALRDCHSLVAGTSGCFFEAGGSGGGAAMSTDAGATWRRPKGHDRHYGWACAADPADPGLWYFSSAPGVRAHSSDADAAIYRCHGAGSSEKLSGGLPTSMKAMPYSLLTGIEANRVVAGLSDGEVWESRDAGDSWSLLLKLPGVNRSMIRIDS
jgi:photosystem II stability/assembly factor-like uncharacterized protein